MTLQEWINRTGKLPSKPTKETGAVSVISDTSSLLHEQLWYLSDYTVSSVTGIVVWLTPKCPGEKI